MRVKCLAQEHNTMSPARARTRSARSGVERANHEATVPPTKNEKNEKKNERSLSVNNVVDSFMGALPAVNNNRHNLVVLMAV